jgi:hypothetical protein
MSLAFLSDPLLARKHSGPLKIIIHTRYGESYAWSFNPILDDLTLFEYIGHACACIFTNMTTRLSITTSPGDWKILEFSPQKKKLVVLQIDGENLTIEEDDDEKLLGEFSNFTDDNPFRNN